MRNDYMLSDELAKATRALLGQMDIDAGERTALVNLVTSAFQGEAGSSNGVFQREFTRRVDEYDQALAQLNTTIANVTGVGGTTHARDKLEAAKYDAILGL
ncbi:hypothetical protein GV794_01300 [Nocardia cyriacigeorgica]|uniref:Uncharacterized protein n=1 Tax=Nocardia cyriacigeorgica TaxID=135487 RepID=A0A6P1D3I9_9NOCA|nr:hypothetical protein [Nocardia cyriacigeorgica]NEW40663.1 hypothetical protein [Nocardia cyriacigeorgica]NEW45136.1 hypothetical protein [Nocardia cyriacigeorgica]NEW51109.1 hypothetical protein [Nocardia cyriacigeorgica]NEW54308.1 hypothetical protein [Nocardia cyriacigeorgica]